MTRFFSIILIAAVFFSRLKIDLELGFTEITVRPSQVVLVLALLAVGFRKFILMQRIKPFTFDKIGLVVFGYFAANLLSSLIAANSQFHSLQNCALILIYIMMFYIIRWSVSNELGIQKSVVLLSGLTKLSVVFGLIVFALFLSFGYDIVGFGLGFGYVDSETASIRAFSEEPNLFAIITASVLSIWLAGRFFSVNRSVSWTMIIATAIGVIFSFTRSVYASLIIAFLVITWLSALKGRPSISKAFTIVAGTALIVVIVLESAPSVMVLEESLSTKMSTIAAVSEGTGVLRLLSYQSALEAFLDSPVFGRGTMTSATFDIPWLYGAAAQALHDTGLIGLFVTMALFIVFLLSNYHAFRDARIREDRALAVGFLASNIVIAIASQSSSILWIGFPWVFWGINAGYLDLRKRLNVKMRKTT